ncbi:MAG: hypothetical protein GXY82_08950 [Methanospirillum sp.]|nr:hypothetical protein [Methanospirillum sp.]
MATYLATVTLESHSDKSPDKNEERLDCALAIADRVASTVPGDCVLLFPGGWFHTGGSRADSIIPSVTARVMEQLATYPNDLVLAFGVDGLMTPKGFDRDQLGLAVGRQGLLALGRKFYLSKEDKKGDVLKTEDHLAREQGYDRVFIFNGRRFFIAVCYDARGIIALRLENPEPGKIDVVLNMVHFFYQPLTREEREDPNVEGRPSGVIYNVRNLVAGASKQWECPAFATATFVNRGITEKYRTGMYWRMGGESVTRCGIDDNSLRPLDMLGFRQPCPEGTAEVRVYDLDRVLAEPEACRYGPGESVPRAACARRAGMKPVLPVRYPGAFNKVRDKVEENGAGEVFDTLVDGLAPIFGDDRHEQDTQVTFFGPNRVGYDNVEKLDLVMLLSHRSFPETLKVKVYHYAIAALFGIDVAEVRASLPPSFEEPASTTDKHPGKRYLAGAMDLEGAARFVAAMRGWALAGGT